ncbi:hypothetical protein D3C76_909740 [compost metagenome]|uniref:hypothetical protein n=1 Tax=Pseudomonas TaxID=286 RepID=UPI0004D9DE15|nr:MULTISPECIES: hypothetical protein [Pseudomonas]KEY86160.1 hypothetical protein PC358_20595 [Pseudomonas capeferrum]MCH7297658.1 hypothetical protein [Pseudomonas capeferrum]MDD2127903.1 hypothetical protein [Pseudomonas sp. 17391]
MNKLISALLLAAVGTAPMLAYAESSETTSLTQPDITQAEARPALEILNTSDKTLYLLKKGKPVGNIQAKSTYQADSAFLKQPAILSWTESTSGDTTMPHVSVRGFGSLCEASVCLYVK